MLVIIVIYEGAATRRKDGGEEVPLVLKMVVGVSFWLQIKLDVCQCVAIPRIEV